MKKIISMMMIASMAMFATSCDKSDDGDEEDFGISGSKYVGTMTLSIPGMDSVPQTDIIYYVDADGAYASVMMPDVSFMSGLMPNLDMALISIPLSSSTPDIYSTATAQMVGLYDHMPLINDVIQGITDVKVVIYDDETIDVSFDCAISTSYLGDTTATIYFEGLKDGAVAPDEFAEGFNITISTGTTSQVEGVTMTYYQGDNTLVVDGFKYNTAIPSGSTLAIGGLTSSVGGNVTTISGNDITVNYTVMGQACTSVVSDLTGEIKSFAEIEAMLSFYIEYNGYNYPCTYNGTITLNEGSYTAQ